MTCNDKCIHFPVCEQKKYDFANIDECVYYQEERPTGEWIFDGHHIRCNKCYEYICNTDSEGNEIPDNYCPNCGAKMKEAENGTDNRNK